MEGIKGRMEGRMDDGRWGMRDGRWEFKREDKKNQRKDQWQDTRQDRKAREVILYSKVRGGLLGPCKEKRVCDKGMGWGGRGGVEAIRNGIQECIGRV